MTLLLKRKGSDELVEVSEATFKSLCIRTRGTTSYIARAEALHWLGVGRIGSHFQIGKDFYIKG